MLLAGATVAPQMWYVCCRCWFQNGVDGGFPDNFTCQHVKMDLGVRVPSSVGGTCTEKHEAGHLIFILTVALGRLKTTEEGNRQRRGKQTGSFVSAIRHNTRKQRSF